MSLLRALFHTAFIAWHVGDKSLSVSSYSGVTFFVTVPSITYFDAQLGLYDCSMV